MADPKTDKRPDDDARQTPGPVREKSQETTDTQDWGERLSEGKIKARGGKESGRVPGAEEGQP